MRRVRPLVALAIAGLTLLPGAVSAAPEVSITGVTVTAGTASVSGTATFAPITSPQSVIGENVVFGGGAVGTSAAGDTAGLKMTDATITPIAGGLRFRWLLESMPSQVPPEGVRYTWAFKIGSRVFQLQAKRTNMASITTLEDPMGHINRLKDQKDFFQLRGSCVANYFGTPEGAPATAGCYHLAFLNGSFDVANKTVTVDLPFETKDSVGRLVAPEFKPGAILEDNAGESTAGMVLSAAFQAVLNTSDTARSINGIDPYYVGPQVVLGAAGPNQDPSAVTYSAPGVLNGSSFTGTVSGLTASKNTVYVRACNGTECSYSSFRAL